MRSRLRNLYRRLTLKHRLKVGGPLHITFPTDGVYLVGYGDRSVLHEAKAGDTLSFVEFKSAVYLGEGE